MKSYQDWKAIWRDGVSGERVSRERVRGIEPPPSAWEAEVLPLNYTRGLVLMLVGRE